MQNFYVDIRLNPALYMPCRQDINKFCKEIMDTADPEDSHTLHGQVIECLKMEYVKGTKSVSSHVTVCLSVTLHQCH